MTPRERMLAAIEFNAPDKIPVVYHPSPAGLHVHGEKLLRLFKENPPDNPIAFDAIPSPPPATVDATGTYHEIRKDEWGTEWEHLVFGIQGHPKTYPFANWDEAMGYQFPPPPPLDRATVAEQRQAYLVCAGWISLFEKLYALRPMDHVLMDIVTEDPALLAFLDRLVEYWLEAVHHMIASGVDVIMLADDWGTQDAPLIAPALFQRIFKPRYEILMAPVRKAGRKIFFHSCGFLGGMLDDLLDLGINGLWPQIKLFEADPSFIGRCQRRKVAIYIHPDRQHLITKGTPAEIETAIRGYAERYHASRGGGIFYVEIENDAPFENVKALIESIHRWR